MIDNCNCRSCINEKYLSGDYKILFESRMIVCPKCDNKRCPHASDHRLECTNSNEPGQPGSVYS